MIENCFLKDTKKQEILQKLKADFDVLNDANRLRILCIIKENKGICVCDIYKSLDLSQNLVSYHLGKLRDSGFVTNKKQGAKVLYKSGEKKNKIFQKLINKLF